MDKQGHHTALIKGVSRRVGDDWYEIEQQVKATLESPGWAFLSSLIDEQRAVVLSQITGKPLDHGTYISLTQRLRAFEMCQQLGPVVLFETARRRETAAQAASSEAAGGREEA